MAKNNRNKPKYPRNEWIECQTPGPSSNLKVTLDRSKNSIKFHDIETDNLKFVRSYKRNNKDEKILLSIKQKDQEVFLRPIDALRSQYDYLVAIDTGTIEINNRRFSATVAYSVPKTLDSYDSEIPFIPQCAYLLTDINPNVNPEKIGWHLVLSRNIIYGKLKPGTRIGVIVDSDLGLHDSINSRKLPYYKNNFLPACVDLVYASDASADELPNQMIRHCDSSVKMILKKLYDPMFPVIDPYNGDENYSGFIELHISTKHL